MPNQMDVRRIGLYAAVVGIVGGVGYAFWRNRNRVLGILRREGKETLKSKAELTAELSHDASHRRRKKLGRSLPQTEIKPSHSAAV
jgi:hypothetical protein